MAIEQRQLQSELSGLQSQLKLVKDQIAELDIRSPINGVVAAWQLKRKLADRPVSRGNHLMAVIEEDGPWQLRLEIPDADAAEVLEVMKSGSDVTVEFAAASRPRSTYHAKLGSVATAARRNAAGSNVIDALATIVPGDESISEQAFGRNQARVGVETTAKITCGQRSLLGSWFGDVADFVNRNILFYIR